MMSFDIENSATPTPTSNKLEQVLFLLDKLCARDKLYHDLSMICDDPPKSCLVKQKRTDLNKICTIQPVPGQYPGAKLSF